MDTVQEHLNEPVSGLPSGIRELDDTILGFDKGEMILIAGRPGMGKSSLARDISLMIGAPDIGAGTILLCSLEMSCEEVGELLAANLAKVDYYNYKRGNSTEGVRTRLDSACAQLSSYNIIINDDSYLTPSKLRELLLELTEKEAIACLIVDYLQLMSLRRKVENRQEEVAEISRELKAIAREFNLPVIALSQLNRNVEYRENTRPRMSDIRESGAMENDCTKVILIHRPSYYDKIIDIDAEDTGEAELIVVKNRKGPNKIVKCAWINTWMGFQDLPNEEF